MTLPLESTALLTTSAKTTSSGGIYFWCRYLFDGEPIGAVWMPDEENHWAQWLDKGTTVIVERLRPNTQYPDRINSTAKLLCDQTKEVQSIVKQSRSDEYCHHQALTMPRPSKDPFLRNEIDLIANATNLKPSQVTRQLCWEAICYRQAVASATKLINQDQ
jgi:hypothetical protein